MISFLKKYLALIAIVVLAFFLRFYNITSIPPSLNWDEVSIGYNAYSILKTGKDEWGVKFPVHFKAYGEYKLPVQIYASIPGIAIFGLNEIGVRITPAIYGTLTVLLLYFLVMELFKNKWVALGSSFFLAISPWHIQLTRASFATYFFLKGFEKPKWLILSVIPFTISVYTYNSARVFTPLFLALVALIYRKRFLAMKKESVIFAFLFFVLLLPLIPFILSGEASARYKLVSITDDAGLIPRIEERRNLSKLPLTLTKLIHNRYTYNTLYFTENYIAHFTPNFLFINGAGHKQHHVQGVGELYWIQAPFLLFGLYLLIKRKDESLKILLPWLFLAFVPVSMTNDSIPNALRTLIAVPVYQIFTAIGIYEFFQKTKSKQLKIVLLVSVTVLLFGLNFGIYLKKYYIDYPINYSRDWQYGNKQVVNYIKSHYNDYDLIVFSRTYGEPHMFTLFFTGWDPGKFQNDPNLNRFETYDWVRVLRFDKFYFPDLGDIGTKFADIRKENPGKKILFIGKPRDFPDSLPRLLTVDFLNGNRAFEIVKVE